MARTTRQQQQHEPHAQVLSNGRSKWGGVLFLRRWWWCPSFGSTGARTQGAAMRLVRVVGDEGGGLGGVAAGAAGVLAEVGERVSLGALEERGLRGGDVLVLAEPGLEAGLLERAAVGEGEGPGLLGVEGVHGVERERGLLLGHAAREEGDAGDGGRHGVLEDADGGLGDFRHGRGRFGRLARADHVGLEERALEEDLVVRELLVARRDDLLGDLGGDLDRVGAVHEDLGLDDGHEAVGLADRRVARERLGVLVDREHRRRRARRVLDVEHGAPFGEARALGIVRRAALAEVVDALRHRLAVGPEQRLHALVDLDAGNDALRLHEVDHRRAARRLVEERLLEGDGARDVLAEAGRLEEELAVLAAVLLDVLDADRREPLPDRPRRLVGGEDALPRGRDRRGGRAQLGGVLAGGHGGGGFSKRFSAGLGLRGY
mmetsp:Transcript_5691/g.23652  ORF Transcript_5691/g.23652 Transcript_5691/m.23652 type:complete len:432 (+) Transcript_5691:393-1688(+)